MLSVEMANDFGDMALRLFMAMKILDQDEFRMRPGGMDWFKRVGDATMPARDRDVKEGGTWRI